MVWKIVLVIYLANNVLSEKGAISEQRVVIHQIKSDHIEKQPHTEGKKSEYREEYAWSYPSFEFSYKVNDPDTHDIKGQHEKRHGDEVTGLYWLIEPNGHKRTVNYQADDNNGFNAQVDYTSKLQSNENKPMNGNENGEHEEIAKEINETNIKVDGSDNKNIEEELINDEQNINEETELVESNLNDQNNFKTQDRDDVSDTESEISYPNENKDDIQNKENDKNENMSREENKEKKVDINNHSKNRFDENTIRYSSKVDNLKNGENGKSRGNQNYNKLRYRNIEQIRKHIIESDKNHVSRGDGKEDSINIDLKNVNDERKEQTANYELHFVALDSKEHKDLAHVNRNIGDNRNKKFEHRIRIHHPKSIKST